MRTGSEVNDQAERRQTQTCSITVDVKRSATMRQVVATELKRSPALLALDLTRVDRIDTEGIATLVSAATQAGESDISFCLVGAHAGPVRAALADAELTELFEIFTSLSDT
jgi:anti-anti-sigma factor